MSIDLTIGPTHCTYAWHDGWGDHMCHLALGHEGRRHVCPCDAEMYSRAEAEADQ